MPLLPSLKRLLENLVPNGEFFIEQLSGIGMGCLGRDRSMVIVDLQRDGIFTGNHIIEHLPASDGQIDDLVLRQFAQILHALGLAIGIKDNANKA